jgi:hypothetical protein
MIAFPAAGIAAIVLDIVGVAAKGLLYLLIIGIVVFLAARVGVYRGLLRCTGAC